MSPRLVNSIRYFTFRVIRFAPTTFSLVPLPVLFFTFTIRALRV